MKKAIPVFLLLLFYIPFTSSAQILAANDSLLQLINSTAKEEVKAAAYISLGKNYLQTDFKKALPCFNKSIEIGYKEKLPVILADAYNNKGIVFIMSGEHAKALAYMDSALKYHKSTGNKQGIANVMGNIGNLYHSTGDNTKSLQYQLICLQMREELNDTTRLGPTYNGIANIYLAQHDDEKALLWYRKCLDMNRRLGNRIHEVAALCNIGIVLVRQNKLKEATAVYQMASSIADSTNNKDGKASAYMGFSQIYIEKKMFNDALSYEKKALEMMNETGNQFKENEAYGKIGEIYFDMNDYGKSIEYFTLFLNKSTEMGMKTQQRSALSNLADCYEKNGNVAMAYKYLSEYTKLNDTLLNDEKIKQATAMQTQFETERKEKENVILESKLKVQTLELMNNRYLLSGLGLLLILSVITASLLMRQNKLKAKQESLQLEQKLLRSQMNPHFIFNCLTTIESFIYENQPMEAGRYLSDFARLMRLILENSQEEYIPLNKEIKTLEYYLSLQKLRLEDHLTYEITTEGIDDPEGIDIPPMLTQPFIENAIEHGFRGISKEGHIDVAFHLIGRDKLQVQVTDNGRGINTTLQDNTNTRKHKSMALQITKERLMVLNKTKKQKVEFSISDISDEANSMTGTRVLFTIPLIYQG
ncbi:MAG: tetratricopeptide repeat protein [Bacteroidota bacterium]